LLIFLCDLGPKPFPALITWGRPPFLLAALLYVRGGERWPEPLAIQPQLSGPWLLGPFLPLALWAGHRAGAISTAT